MDLERSGDAVIKNIVKKTVHNKLNTTVNDLENKIPLATSFIHATNARHINKI